MESKISVKILKKIGFEKKIICKDIIYYINTINGYFYYNYKKTPYKWYLVLFINKKQSNYIHLNIQNIEDLYILLSIFQIKFNYIKP